MQYLTYDLFKRTFNLYDLLADVLGALFALVFLESRKKKNEFRKEKNGFRKGNYGLRKGKTAVWKKDFFPK